MASAPASTMTMETTPAKIGRSMKKRDRPIVNIGSREEELAGRLSPCDDLDAGADAL